MSSLLAASLLWMALAQTELLRPGAAPGRIASEKYPAIPGNSSREARTAQALEREDARQSGQPEASNDEPDEETESERTSGRPDGGHWGFSGSGVTFSIAEMHVNYELASGQPGRIHAGLWLSQRRVGRPHTRI